LWPLAAGRWPLAAGRWPLAAGRWPLAAGRWPLAAGSGQLATKTLFHTPNQRRDLVRRHREHDVSARPPRTTPDDADHVPVLVDRRAAARPVRRERIDLHELRPRLAHAADRQRRLRREIIRRTLHRTVRAHRETDRRDRRADARVHRRRYATHRR